MIALADAVIPIMRLLVAVATRSGTPMRTCMTGTLTSPPPTPSRARRDPGPDAPDGAEPEVANPVARPGQGGREGAVQSDFLADDGLRFLDLRSPVRATGHRQRDVQQQGREEHLEDDLGKDEGNQRPGERAGRGEQLEHHAKPKVRDTTLQIDAG